MYSIRGVGNRARLYLGRSREQTHIIGRPLRLQFVRFGKATTSVSVVMVSVGLRTEEPFFLRTVHFRRQPVSKVLIISLWTVAEYCGYGST